MNHAIRTFITAGIILMIYFIIGRFIQLPGSEIASWFAVAFFLIAFSIRFLGYLLKRDKLRKAKY